MNIESTKNSVKASVLNCERTRFRQTDEIILLGRGSVTFSFFQFLSYLIENVLLHKYVRVGVTSV